MANYVELTILGYVDEDEQEVGFPDGETFTLEAFIVDGDLVVEMEYLDGTVYNAILLQFSMPPKIIDQPK